MRIFTQQQKQSRVPVSISLTRPHKAAPGLGRQHPAPHLQRSIGNQTVPEMLQTDSAEQEAGVTGMASPCFGHDFSQIPIYPLAAGVMQTKLGINEPGDVYEQGADRVSDQVMCTSELQLQRTCGGSEGSRTCRTWQLGQEHEHFPSQSVRSSDLAQSIVPPIVSEVLAAPGQPLDPTTRDFMESRFGHDFSQVRVHTDSKAAESARAMNALSYTIGHDMAFGAGRYVPATSEGRRLVAHELTHVLQQTTPAAQVRPADFGSPSGGSIVLQRQPDKPTQTEQRREQQLEELARNPGEAHLAWKKLSDTDRSIVTEKMRRRYGGPFAQQFLDAVKKGKPQIETHHYSRGVGPKPSELIQRGYQRGWTQHLSADMALEWWVHPSGWYITIDVGTWKSGAAETEKETGTKAPPPKLPPIEGPQDKVPPMTEEQERALNALEDLQARNNELQEALLSDPFPKQKAENAQASWAFSRAELRDLKNVNMDDVYPDFWKEVDSVTSENDDLLKKLCVQDRFFCIE